MDYSFNRVLKRRSDIDEATSILHAENLIPHGISCKDYEVLMVAKSLGDGDICDLGADGSWTLWNAVRMGLKGEKHGIDLIVPEKDYGEIQMIKGDLMHTPYKDGQFDYVTCMSVIEHQVDYTLFAKEASRILKKGGTLIVSCDFWDPKPDTSLTKLYSLDWNILDINDANRLIEELRKEGLVITSTPDFTLGEAVINPSYCSPAQGVSYTFLFLKFIKQ